MSAGLPPPHGLHHLPARRALVPRLALGVGAQTVIAELVLAGQGLEGDRHVFLPADVAPVLL